MTHIDLSPKKRYVLHLPALKTWCFRLAYQIRITRSCHKFSLLVLYLPLRIFIFPVDSILLFIFEVMNSLLEQVKLAATSASEAERKVILNKLRDVADSIGELYYSYERILLTG